MFKMIPKLTRFGLLYSRKKKKRKKKNAADDVFPEFALLC